MQFAPLLIIQGTFLAKKKKNVIIPCAISLRTYHTETGTHICPPKICYLAGSSAQAPISIFEIWKAIPSNNFIIIIIIIIPANWGWCVSCQKKKDKEGKSKKLEIREKCPFMPFKFEAHHSEKVGVFSTSWRRWTACCGISSFRVHPYIIPGWNRLHRSSPHNKRSPNIPTTRQMCRFLNTCLVPK